MKFATRVFSLQADFSRRLEKRPALRGPGEHAQSLIQPPADDTLCADKVTTRVNNPDYQEDELRPAHTSSDPNASGSS